EFNEVFFDNARVPAENLVGNLNEGWSVAITTLAYERDLLTFIRHISLRNALHRLVKLAQSRGRGADPVVRQKIAELWIGEQALALNGYRSLTRILNGGQPGPEGSTSKLFWSRLDQDLVLVPGWVSNIEVFWEEPSMARFLQRLASFSRLILFDKRGTGLSDRVSDMPNLETRMDDVRAVMDAVRSTRAALLGYSEGGPL